MLHGRFLLFNPAHLGHARTAMQERRKTIERLGVSDGVDLHPAVILVADPPSQSDLVGGVFNEPAEADSLHAPGNKPATSADPGLLQLGCSGGDGGFEPASVASMVARSFLTVKGLGIRRKPFSTT